jgi:molybdate transport system substrate-binding protein
MRLTISAVAARLAGTLLAILVSTLTSGVLASEPVLRIAAAADLKFALEEIVTAYRRDVSADSIEVVYGSSGKLSTQIQQGAPYDLFLSADIGYVERLAAEGYGAGPVIPYGVGRIVLWSATRDASGMRLSDLADPGIGRIAIANPRHAPYGKRAEEALRAAGIWDRIEKRLVMGENIAQTAQYVLSGNAGVGIVALSLALNPELARRGGYALIDEALHQPLRQGLIVTRRGGGNPAARRFADYLGGQTARRVLTAYGFSPPDR